MSFIEIKQKIEEFHLKNDYNSILTEIRSLAALSPFSIGSTVNAGAELYRSTSHHVSLPTRIEELWYPPADKVQKYGRANKPNQSLFYCCSDPNGAFRELRVSVGHVVILTKWATKKELILHDIGYTEEVFKKWSAPVRASKDHKEKEEMINSNALNKEIRDYLFTLFTEPGDNFYLITSAISEMFMNGEGISGLKYPSIAKGGTVDNLVLTPESVHTDLILVEAKVVTIDTHKGEFNGEISGTVGAQLIDQTNGDLKWDVHSDSDTTIEHGEGVAMYLRPGMRKVIMGDGLVIINGSSYNIKPGYYVELIENNFIVFDLKGNKVSPI